jgi:prepilin-type N-terminal cleavage/methylation domain-containing protein
MRKRNEKGFTLIEVVVVVAVIAILAAVLTPYITKYIDDSKIAKARNEAQVIAAAVANAYKDLGRWPNQINAGTNYGVLYTGTVLPAATFISAAATASWPPPAAATWNSLDTHLVTNGHGYLATGDLRWAGPYATTLPLDPWGRPYAINAVNFIPPPLPAAPLPVWVLSAGPNGVIDTPITAATTVPSVDDIGFRVR